MLDLHLIAIRVTAGCTPERGTRKQEGARFPACSDVRKVALDAAIALYFLAEFSYMYPR